MKPLGRNMLVKIKPTEKFSEGGIALPETIGDKETNYKEAVVVALGTGIKLDSGEMSKFGCDVGETVLISHYMGTPVEANGQPLMLIREEDILSVIEA